MENKELTATQKARRKYEDINKEERKRERVQFTTSFSRKTYNKITEFLKKHNISKVDLILTGFNALVEKYENQDQETK